VTEPKKEGQRQIGGEIARESEKKRERGEWGRRRGGGEGEEGEGRKENSRVLCKPWASVLPPAAG
jgi:hypothetical protein